MLTPAPTWSGPIESGFARASTSFVHAARLAALVPAALLAPLAAPDGHRLTAGLAAGLTILTAAAVLLTLRRAHRMGQTGSAATRTAQLVDVLVLLADGLGQSQLVTTEAARAGTGLVCIAVQLAVTAYAVQLRPRRAFVLVVLLSGAYLTGGSQLPGSNAAVWTGWLVAVGLLSSGARTLTTRVATGTDRALLARQQADRARELAAGRRADERSRRATLHDTVASTLLMVGSGTVHRDDAWLRSQAGRDLALLTGAVDSAPVLLPLPDLLLALAAASPLPAQLLELDLDPALRTGPEIPPGMLRAVADAVREALTNVYRHAGDQTPARLVAQPLGGGFQVMVEDAGVGFDPAAVAGTHRGLRESILDRADRAGVTATVSSTPGAGTAVRLEWPGGAQAPEMARELAGASPSTDPARAPDDDAVDGSLRMAQRLRLVALLIPLTLFCVVEPPAVLASRDQYREVGLQFAALALLTAVVLAAGALARSGRPGRVARPALLLVAGAAVLLAAHDLVPGGVAGPGHWSLTDAGWVVVVVLSRSRPGVVAAGLAVAAALNLSPLLTGSHLSQGNAISGATLIGGIAGVQLAVTLAIRMVSGWAQLAQQTAGRESALATREGVAVQVHAERAGHYRDLGERVEPLLHGLIDGTLDPADEDVRRTCALEAARLRRMFAENDASVTPLLHELGAGVEVAEGRGIAVHVVVLGEVPALALDVRRALVDTVSAVLTIAASRARITVLGEPGRVSVSVLADVPSALEPSLPVDLNGSVDGTMELVVTRAEDALWLELSALAPPSAPPG